MVIFVFGTLAMQAQPKLEIVGGDTYDWGEVSPDDSPLKTKVRLKNVGDKELIIEQVRPGCGCTTAPLNTDRLAPGAFATMDVQLKVSHYTNQVHKTISIRSNDPDNRVTIYHLKAYVVRPISTFPNFINMTNSVVGQKNTGKIVLRNSTDKPITIKSISHDVDGLTLDVKEGAVIPAKGQLAVQATLNPEKPGRIKGIVRMMTDSEKAPTIEFRIYGSARLADNPQN